MSDDYRYDFVRYYDQIWGYMINNRTKLDDQGNVIILATFVEEMFPGVHFILMCTGELCSIYFERALTQEELDNLTALVAEYQIIQPSK